jgi:6-pyruvoyl-tetrahydropterin synthase related domain
VEAAPPAVRRPRAVLGALLDVAVIVAALVFIGSYFPRSVMFADTTTNGGDMGSHFYPAVYLREVLLPRGQVVGWCPGNYCGFPLFQFYFPLPFLIAAAMSLAIPLTVAFKLATVLGTFMLPPCAYLGLRLAGVPFPGPALGVLASLPFLFIENNSMWGANIPSTLAGEFTFSFATALAVLFLGTLHRTMETGRGRAWNGLLVALIGLSHGYALLWAGATSLTEAISTRHWWRRVGTLFVVHGLGILLMAFWLVPLLAYLPWSTAYSHVWYLRAFWAEVLPPILQPMVAIAVLGTAGVGVHAAWRRQPFPRGLAKVWAGALVGMLFYLTARTFHVVDIRFVPFFQLGICLAAAASVGHLLAALPMPELWPAIGVLAVLPYVQSGVPPEAAGAINAQLQRIGIQQPIQFYRGVSFIPSWITWNYSGFERKSLWGTFKALNDHLRGTYRDPRVVYEHSSDNEALGTVRAFESLPLFSGRSTLEGLYMQAAATSPFVFYTQSEISQQMSCPFPDYGCAHLDLEQGLEHLRMFNVSQFIVRSAKVKAEIAKTPGLVREFGAGNYEIYRVEGNDGRYAVPLAQAPVLVLTHTWKEDAYRWFKRARPADPVPVFAEEVDPAEREAFGAVVDHLPAEYTSRSLGALPPLTEEMGYQSIKVKGCTPGHPVLVRISYHPRWRSLSGEKVWLAAPSFMLVFPKGEEFELVFDGGPPMTLGFTLSVAGWLVFVIAILPVGRRLGRTAAAGGEAIAAVPPVSIVRRQAERLAEGPVRTRRLLLGGLLVVAAGAFAVLAFETHATDADTTYHTGQKIYDQGDLEEALPYFRTAQRLAPLSNTAVHSTYYESIVLFRLERWAEAEKSFQRLIDTYPEAVAAAESLYHIGICRVRLGDMEGAKEAWRETRRRYPESPWAGHAAQRLAEAGEGGAAQ